jgi:hydrogenase maturation factor
MTSIPSPVGSCGNAHCVTCGDDGVPMRVLRVNERTGLALCADGEGRRRTVEVALVWPVAAGGRVLVHAGAAIAALAGEPDLPPPAVAVARPGVSEAAP